MASLALHLSAFGLARTIAHWREVVVTELRAMEPEPPQAGEPSPPPEEDELRPGIEKGAPALATWIGYEEYKQHLAQLGETDQAAFTSAIARGLPESTSAEQVPPQQTPPDASPPAGSPPVESVAAVMDTPPVGAKRIDEPQTGESAPESPEAAQAQTKQPAPAVESFELPAEPSGPTLPAPLESQATEERPAEATQTKPHAIKPVVSDVRDEPTRVEPAPKVPQPIENPLARSTP